MRISCTRSQNAAGTRSSRTATKPVRLRTLKTLNGTRLMASYSNAVFERSEKDWAVEEGAKGLNAALRMSWASQS